MVSTRTHASICYSRRLAISGDLVNCHNDTSYLPASDEALAIWGPAVRKYFSIRALLQSLPLCDSRGLHGLKYAGVRLLCVVSRDQNCDHVLIALDVVSYQMEISVPPASIMIYFSTRWPRQASPLIRQLRYDLRPYIYNAMCLTPTTTNAQHYAHRHLV